MLQQSDGDSTNQFLRTPTSIDLIPSPIIWGGSSSTAEPQTGAYTLSIGPVVTPKGRSVELKGKELLFRATAETLPVEQEKGDDPRRFRILVNTGEPVMYGTHRLVVDLATLHWKQSNNLPVFFAHDEERPIGVTDNVVRTTDGIVAEGRFLSNPDAQRVVQDADDGFPWEASFMAIPGAAHELQEGETVEVNGQPFAGPGVVLQDTLMREITVCSLGADGGTHTQAFGAVADVAVPVIEREREMSEAVATPEPAQMQEPDAASAATEAPAEGAAVTVADIKAERPEWAAVIDAAIAEAMQRGIEAERARAAEIADASVAAGATPQMSQVVAESIKTGAQTSEAYRKFLQLSAKAGQKQAMLNASQAAEEDIGDDGDAGDGGNTLDAWKAEYQNSPKLQAQFVSADIYAAFQEANAAGAVRIAGQRKGDD